MGTPSSLGLQVGTAGNPSPGVASTNPGYQEPSPDRRGGAEANGQGCSKEGHPLCRSIPQPDLPSPQERWVIQTSHKPETPESVYAAEAHFKMENLGMMRDLLREGTWMASIDLKDAYLSVKIWEDHRKYLRFLWQDSTYKLKCLPFSLCSAPRVFTKLLKPVLARVHHQGVRLIMYLDDVLVMAQSREELQSQLLQITSLLELLGFVVNREKSQLLPTQVIQYLGFLVDSREMKIKLTEEKAVQITTACRKARQKGSLSVRELARLIGKMT